MFYVFLQKKQSISLFYFIFFHFQPEVLNLIPTQDRLEMFLPQVLSILDDLNRSSYTHISSTLFKKKTNKKNLIEISFETKIPHFVSSSKIFYLFILGPKKPLLSKGGNVEPL